MVFVSLGTLDTEIHASPEYHQYVQSLPSWASIDDTLPCHEIWPVEDD